MTMFDWKKLPNAVLSRLPEPLRLPIKVALLAGVATALLTLLIPNKYASEGRILPGDAKGSSSLAGLASAAAMAGISVPGQDSSDTSYIDILNSYWLKKKLLESQFRFHIKSSRFGPNKLKETTLQEHFKIKNIDRGIKLISGILSVNRDMKSRLITIRAQTKSPELSQAIVQRTISLLDEFVITKSKTKGGAKAHFAEQRLKDARLDMDEAEQKFQNFLNVNRNYLLSPDPSIRLKGIRHESEWKLRQQLVATLALSYEQALMDEKNDMAIINILDNGNLPIDKSGPARSRIVLLITFLSGSLAWVWANRAMIRSYLFSDGAQGNPDAASPESDYRGR